MVFSIQKKNAIKNVLFVFEHIPLSQESLKEIAENAVVQEALSALPKKTVAHAMRVEVGAQPAVFAPSQPQFISSVSFESYGKDGQVDLGISVQENATVVVCGTYDGWTTVVERISDYLRALVPFVFAKTTVINVLIQYVDEFSSSGEKSEFKLKEILNPDPYFSASIFQAGGIGHCHTGFFEATDGVDGKVLHNLNLNILENPNQYVVQVTVLHKAHLNNHLHQLDVKDFNAGGLINSLLNALHVKHKSVIARAFSDEAKARIGFEE